MKRILIVLNIFALIGTLLWLICNPDWEPLIAVITSISTLIALLYSKNDKEKNIKMQQKGGKGSTNYQSAGNINITNNDKR